MLRRSLLIFLGFVLLSLLLTVGYAISGLSGPETALREAGQALQRGRPDDALRIIAQAEKSLGPTGGSVQLRRKLLELRCRCNLATRNYAHAREDLEQLVNGPGKDDLNLNQELVRVLIQGDDPEAALKHAIRLLNRTPGDGRTLELAGEASQKLYRKKLEHIFDYLKGLLSEAKYRDAADALLPYLYRKDSDPLAQKGKRDFQEVLRQFDPLALLDERLQRDIDEARALIDDAQRYFIRSLETGGTPVAAYNGLAYALTQGKREDDLVALSETYLRRFDHSFTITAAINIMQVHFAAHRFRAVVALADRFLPEAEWKARYKERKLTADIGAFMLLKARALYGLEDREGLQRLNQTLKGIAEATPFKMEVESIFAKGFEQDLAGESWALEQTLAELTWRTDMQAKPTIGEDLLVYAFRMRLRALERCVDATVDPMVHLQQVFRWWIEFRKDDPEPYLRRAKYRIHYKRPFEAWADAQELLKKSRLQRRPKTAAETVKDPKEEEPRQSLEEEALRVLADAANLYFAQSGRDSDALLQQCLRLRTEMPKEVDDPIQYLALARRALEPKPKAWPRIALACAREASQRFPWARWPRYLQAEADLQLGEFERAARMMEKMRESYPDDLTALHYLREARYRAGLSNDRLLFDVALSGEVTSELAMTLVRRALARHDYAAATRFAAKALPTNPSDAEIPMLVATTLAAAGETAAARAVLRPWVAFLSTLPRRVAGRMVEQYLGLAAKENDTAEVQTFGAAAAALLADDADALFRIAHVLADAGETGRAYEVVRMVFDDPVHAPRRTGEHYLLAGRLALELGLYRVAEDHLTAAMTFEDGDEATVLLAVMLVRDERVDEARDALRDHIATDLAGAALAVELDLAEQAGPWIRYTLEHDPTNVGANCIRAIADPHAPVESFYREAATAAPDRLIDIFMMLDQPGFTAEALRDAQELADELPGSPVSGYLLGRALIAADRLPNATEVLGHVARNHAFLPAYDELVRILGTTNPDALNDIGFQTTISTLVTSSGGASPPRLRAVVLKNVAAAIAKQTDPSAANRDWLVALWTDQARETQPGRSEVDVLIDFDRPLGALQVVDFLYERITKERLPEFFAWFAERVQRILAEDPTDEVLAAITERVDTWMGRHGRYGSLVHIKLAEMDRQAGGDRSKLSNADLEEERQLLEAHLDLFDEGVDWDEAVLQRSLERLVAIDGRDVVLERVEGLLHDDPSLLRMWVLRARLLEQQGKDEDALHGLSWLFPYVNDPEVLLEYSRIAAESGLATQADEERLLRDLDAEAAETPEASLVRGLLAVRMGRPEEAEEFLAKAAPRPDGAHIYFRALAYLAIPGDEATQHAAELLRQFDAGYGDSNLSEIAAHLAVQLALPVTPSEPTLDANDPKLPPPPPPPDRLEDEIEEDTEPPSAEDH
jgi:hypothetical protein